MVSWTVAPPVTVDDSELGFEPGEYEKREHRGNMVSDPSLFAGQWCEEVFRTEIINTMPRLIN